MNTIKAFKLQQIGKKEESIVEVSVRFGNPKYPDCRNFGICKMELSSESTFMTNRVEYYSNAQLKLVNEKLWLCFYRSSIHPNTRNGFFRSKRFKVEEIKPLGKEICEKLNISSFLILPKNYEIHISKQFYSIELTE